MYEEIKVQELAGMRESVEVERLTLRRDSWRAACMPTSALVGLLSRHQAEFWVEAASSSQVRSSAFVLQREGICFPARRSFI